MKGNKRALDGQSKPPLTVSRRAVSPRRFGEFSEGGIYNKYCLRFHFCHAISELCPQVWESLRNDVLPFTGEIAALKGPARYSHPALSEWVRHFHFESAQWLKVVAIDTLFLWQTSRGDLNAMNIAHPRTTAFVPEDAQNFVFRGWRVGEESGKAYLEQLSLAAREYMETQSKIAEAAGFIRSAGAEIPKTHLQWLAQWQAAESSLKQIMTWNNSPGFARGTVSSDSAVRMGISRVAKQIGIVPREAVRGPRKNRTF